MRTRRIYSNGYRCPQCNEVTCLMRDYYPGHWNKIACGGCGHTVGWSDSSRGGFRSWDDTMANASRNWVPGV
mgnify:CR=1 FL=1